MVFDGSRGQSKVTRFVYWDDAKRFQKSVLGAPYLFLEDGFFKLVNPINFSGFVLVNLAYFYAIFLLFSKQQLGLWAISCLLFYAFGAGTLMGSHRMWCHRAYRGRFALRAALMLCHSVSFQWTIFEWVRAHRTHHKFVDTDGDPHNSKRGFCFAHAGWVVQKEHPLVALKAAQVDMSDIWSDPVIRFNYNYQVPLHLLIGLVLPILAGVFLLNEPFLDTFIIVYAAKSYHCLQASAFTTSAAHMFGDKPYNGKIASVENSMVSIYAGGEGYHNYHHTYPWDYGAGETGNWFNITKVLIEVSSKLGLAYKLRQATPEIIARTRASRLAKGNEAIEQEF